MKNKLLCVGLVFSAILLILTSCQQGKMNISSINISKPVINDSTCLPDGTSYTTQYGINECNQCCSNKCYHLGVGCAEGSECTPSHRCGEEPGKVGFEDIQTCENKENKQDCYWQVIYDAINPQICQYEWDSDNCKNIKKDNAKIIFDNDYCKLVEDIAIGVNDECYSFLGEYYPSEELCNKITNDIYKNACIKNIST